MSSVQHLREFISERLTAAAEEIFTEFEKTIVQYEEKMDRQRRLMDITWKPPGNFHTAEVLHQYVSMVDKVSQQLCNQKLNSNLDQETPESVHIKEGQEKLLTSKEGGQLLPKDETDGCSVTPAHEEIYQRDPAPNKDQVPSLPVILSYTSLSDEHSHLDGTRVEDSEPTSLKRHETVHTDGKRYSCETCGKRFKEKSKLTLHVRTHTGERPFSCKVCGKSFYACHNLLRHMRAHTDKKPYPCTTCGKCFSQNGTLLDHMRIHTGEKPYLCKTCGKCFNQDGSLLRHMKTHARREVFV